MSRATLRTARFPEERELVRTLFREYQAAIGVDLCFQGFDAELRDLPGGYAEPKGFVLLAENEGQVIGCVALKPLSGDHAEMKRLFIRPAGRGQGVGRQLVDELIRRTRSLGYAHVCLDTLPSMRAARALYRSRGFAPIGAYRHNPVPGVEYFELSLRDEPATPNERPE